MPHYIILFNFTDQGIRNVKDTIKRSKAFEGALEQAGAKDVGLYYTLGKHDVVRIVEAPNDEAIASLTLSLGRLGNVRTETLRAFTMEEAANIIERL